MISTVTRISSSAVSSCGRQRHEYCPQYSLEIRFWRIEGQPLFQFAVFESPSYSCYLLPEFRRKKCQLVLKKDSACHNAQRVITAFCDTKMYLLFSLKVHLDSQVSGSRVQNYTPAIQKPILPIEFELSS